MFRGWFHFQLRQRQGKRHFLLNLCAIELSTTIKLSCRFDIPSRASFSDTRLSININGNLQVSTHMRGYKGSSPPPPPPPILLGTANKAFSNFNWVARTLFRIARRTRTDCIHRVCLKCGSSIKYPRHVCAPPYLLIWVHVSWISCTK